jgi:hypothetical protein
MIMILNNIGVSIFPGPKPTDQSCSGKYVHGQKEAMPTDHGGASKFANL